MLAARSMPTASSDSDIAGGGRVLCVLKRGGGLLQVGFRQRTAQQKEGNGGDGGKWAMRGGGAEAVADSHVAACLSAPVV